MPTHDLDALRPAWARIDLDALTRNLGRLRDAVAPARVTAVVKADAYGHGAVHISRALEQSAVDCLAVAMPEEGIELRRAGIRAPILVLGVHLPAQIPLLVDADLLPTISTRTQLAAWSTRSGHQPQPIHLKVDTGMNRLGFSLEQLPGVLAKIRRSSRLELVGLVSHFAAANDPPAVSNALQEERWREIEALLAPAERQHVVRHLANSAAALHRPGSRLDMVRSGLALYGVDPAGRLSSLEPVMSVHARVVQLRRVASGQSVGYNHRWQARRDSRVGILPLGYADGYHWRLGGRAQALAGGHRVDVVGAVSMDMTAVDLTDSELREGDQVTLLGSCGNASISALELAEWAGTISYEVLVSFGLRLPRLYVQDGAEPVLSGRLVAGPSA